MHAIAATGGVTIRAVLLCCANTSTMHTSVLLLEGSLPLRRNALAASGTCIMAVTSASTEWLCSRQYLGQYFGQYLGQYLRAVLRGSTEGSTRGQYLGQH
jgi:hypothetical protein